MQLSLRYGSILLAAGLLSAPRPSAAVVEVLTPLAQFIEQSDEIVVVKVEQLDPQRPSTIFKVSDDLKGKSQFRQLAVNLKGKKADQTEQILARLADGLPVVLFITHLKDRELAYGYSNGTWFQVIGHHDGDQTRWGFTDLEIYLPRTFNGTTDELQRTLTDAIAGKQKPPAANSKVKPGIGPAIDKSTDDH